MKKPKILIADSLEDFRETLADALRQLAQVRITVDGPGTLEMLTSYQPDTLILDMALPGLDGIDLIRRMSTSGCRPMILATTRCASGYVMDTCDRLEVDYIMSRPCEIRSTVNHALDLCARRKSAHATIREPTVILSRMLLRMGLANSHYGCPYIQEAILLMSRDRSQAVTKELYPAVAAIFGINGDQVETGIRRALHQAWERRDNDVWKEYLKPDGTGTVPRPSNGNFICRMADLLNLRTLESGGK